MIHGEDLGMSQQWREKIQKKAKKLLDSRPKVVAEVAHMLDINIENMNYGQ